MKGDDRASREGWRSEDLPKAEQGCEQEMENDEQITQLNPRRNERMRLRYICPVSMMSFVCRCHVIAISLAQDEKYAKAS